jgi:hypothetical protein
MNKKKRNHQKIIRKHEIHYIYKNQEKQNERPLTRAEKLDVKN